MKVLKYIERINAISRAKDWRLSFVPFITGCVYLWLFYFNISLDTQSFILFLLSLTTTFGFASLGYFINEFFDKASDKKAGKHNKLSVLKPRHQFLLFFSTLLLTFLPWIFLPSNTITYILIACELSLFLLYSLPFPRLKVVPLVSNIIDAAYAYVVPLVLSFYTYSLFAQSPLDSFIFFFAFAAFIIGFRNILIHQINDVLSDQKAGIENLPIKLGVYNSNILLKMLLVLEFVSVNIFTMLIVLRAPEFILWWAFYLIYVLYKLYHSRYKFSSLYFSIQQDRHITDPTYQISFPLIALIVLISIDWKWCILIPMQVLILTPATIFQPLLKFWKWFYLKMIIFVTVHVRHALSMSVNYPIYYAFLLFGVDLIKEKKSALEFLKSKFQ